MANLKKLLAINNTNLSVNVRRKKYLKIITLDTIDSTNDYASRLACAGQEEITIVRAHRQTAGRGRLGRDWASPAHQGIYASFIVRPQNPLHELVFLPLLGALAVTQTIGKYLPLTIKLPNDIMVRGKKISGTLVEARGAQDRVEFAIVGIGININTQARELSGLPATSLYLETGKEEPLEPLFKKLVGEFVAVYTRFMHGDLAALLKETYPFQEKRSLKRLTEVFTGPGAFKEIIRFV
ncbi:MAG: biotin--[acetyl-CoA-carboxylase] ligase [Candidatus Omnitrophota bacterium]|nr:biotin--[acetyl-CoA-carboxylase] ligase [Candidatus Omnitrophota bacterium]